MSDYETVRYAQDEAVAVITIWRPDAMNSFNDELRRDLLAACDRAAADESVRAVVITGDDHVKSSILFRLPQSRGNDFRQKAPRIEDNLDQCDFGHGESIANPLVSGTAR